MKIIRITGREALPDIDFHPDSALLLPGRPLFYPDFAGQWHARLFLAVHINRLGKSVSVKFAPRYFDSLSLGLQFAPADSRALLPGVLSGLDSSITHGEWLAPDRLSELSAVTVNGQGETVLPLPSPEEIAGAVSRISTYTTLRMGDIVLLPLEVEPLAIAPRTRLDISCPSGPVLNLKIV